MEWDGAICGCRALHVVYEVMACVDGCREKDVENGRRKERNWGMKIVHKG